MSHMSENNLPLVFKVGNGNTIVSPKFISGVLYVHVTRNSSKLIFDAGQSISEVECKLLKEQIEVIPDAVFEFTDIELGLNFFKGFFREPDIRVVDTIRNEYRMWHLTLCA